MRRNRFSQRFSVANTISQFCYRGDMYRLMYQDIRPLGKRCKRRKPDVSPEKTIRLPGIKTVSKRFTVRERGMRHFQRAYCDQFIFIDDARPISVALTSCADRVSSSSMRSVISLSKTFQLAFVIAGFPAGHTPVWYGLSDHLPVHSSARKDNPVCGRCADG